MPSGKKLRAPKAELEESPTTPEDAETAADEPPQAAVDEQASEAAEAEAPEAVTAETADEETAATVEEPATKQERRRWRGFQKRRKDEVEDTAPAAEGEPAADETGSETTEPTAEAAEAEPVLVPHRPAGKRLTIAAAVAAVLFVAGGAFAGATAQPVIANRALVETKLDIARTAANAITTLWSYTPENMDKLAERSARYLTGDFAFQYRKFIDSIVATNKQAQVTNSTSVLGAAVESVNQSQASAIVYTNSVATSPVSKNIPSLRYLSYRLEMTRDRSEWRITRMTTVTSLDLTPQV